MENKASCDTDTQSQSLIDQGKWKCLFCDLVNESHTTACAHCEKPNTAVVNINQICLCGRRVSEYPFDWDQCRSCCKVIETKQKGYYRCTAEQCIYTDMRGLNFMVCNDCYESEHRSKIESKHNFLFHKVASMIDQINKEAKQCKDNNERRRYMHFVYTVLYKGCIAKLSKFMNDNEYKEVQHIFHTFYGEVMDEIKQNIDSKQLGLASDMIGNQN
eukprot:49486_1